MINLLSKILREKGKNLGFEWKTNRFDILSIIEYSFEYPDPKPEDEKIVSAKITISNNNQEQLVADPYTLAINSIRGKAFELLALAVESDSKKNYDSKQVELSADLKRLFESLLVREETRAIMFLFGRYVPFFFFRDKNWLKSLLNKIFPTDNEKKYLYLAAWEGYLSNNLYLEIFKEKMFQNLYKRAIVLSEKDYPHQKHFTDPDEGIASHFALAYIVMDFGFGNELFDYFWKDGSTEQHIAFVNRLGRIFVSSENPKVIQLISKDENAKQKLKDMWSWLLENHTNVPSIFDEIGFWIDLDKGIFQVKELANFLVRTLVITNGYLKWYIGLQENIVALAKGSPEDTVEVARLYLLEGGVRQKSNMLYYKIGEEWIDAFRILYTQPATRQITYSLINDLIREGRSYFWPLTALVTS